MRLGGGRDNAVWTIFVLEALGLRWRLVVTGDAVEVEVL